VNPCVLSYMASKFMSANWPISVTCCPQLCTGIQPDARFPAWSADALHATLYGISPRRYTEIGLIYAMSSNAWMWVTLGRIWSG
jgi:hypothetical protein